MKRNALSSSIMLLLSPILMLVAPWVNGIQNRLSHNQSWWCASFRHLFKCTQAITSFKIHSQVYDQKFTRFVYYLWITSSQLIWMCSFFCLWSKGICHCHMLNIIFMDFTNSSFYYISLPLADLNTIFFPS
jgi:hypothetical protein